MVAQWLDWLVAFSSVVRASGWMTEGRGLKSHLKQRLLFRLNFISIFKIPDNII